MHIQYIHLIYNLRQNLKDDKIVKSKMIGHLSTIYLILTDFFKNSISSSITPVMSDSRHKL